MKLYELVGQYKNLEVLEEQEGLTQEMLADALKGIEGSIEDKIIGMCSYIKNLESDATGLAGEVKRLQDKKKTTENKVEAIKSYMFEQLKALNMQKVKTPLFNVNIQNNPASLNILDESLIPTEYFTPQQPVLDKKLLLSSLKAKEIIPGVEIKQTERIQIR